MLGVRAVQMGNFAAMVADPKGPYPACKNRIGTWLCERCGRDVRNRKDACPAVPTDKRWRFRSEPMALKGTTVNPAVLTDGEATALQHLALSWNAFVQLTPAHPDETSEFRRLIHAAQSIVAARVAARTNPDIFFAADSRRAEA